MSICIAHLAYNASNALFVKSEPLACSLTLSRLDYCNAVLHGARPAASAAARVVLRVPK